GEAEHLADRRELRVDRLAGQVEPEALVLRAKLAYPTRIGFLQSAHLWSPQIPTRPDRSDCARTRAYSRTPRRSGARTPVLAGARKGDSRTAGGHWPRSS